MRDSAASSIEIAGSLVNHIEVNDKDRLVTEGPSAQSSGSRLSIRYGRSPRSSARSMKSSKDARRVHHHNESIHPVTLKDLTKGFDQVGSLSPDLRAQAPEQLAPPGTSPHRPLRD